ncbi:MAG: PDZ domain-containing protein [Pyrinomonadaceae bacterium]
MFIKRKLAAISALAFVSFLGASTATAQQPVPFPSNGSATGFRFTLAGGSYLGVQTENVSNENFAKYNLREPRGVAVIKVIENSPASKAGLQKGDVIINFDGEALKSEGKLLRMIGEVAPDQKAELTVLRNGGEIRVTVTMGKREEPMFRAFGNGNGMVIPAPPDELRRLRVPPVLPNDDFNPPPAPNMDDNFFIFGRAGRKLGVTVTPLSKQLAEYFGSSTGKGVLIDEVREQSAAAQAGLRAGDVILEIDGETVSDQTDLVRILNKKTEGDVSLTILRDKQRLTVRATPDTKKQTPPRSLDGQKQQ